MKARNWKDVRKEAEARGKLDEANVAEHRQRLLSEVRAYKLREIRDAYGINQDALASRLGVSQSRVSRIERGDMEHAELATLRSYIRALGGELEISARFGDERITLD